MKYHDRKWQKIVIKALESRAKVNLLSNAQAERVWRPVLTVFVSLRVYRNLEKQRRMRNRNEMMIYDFEFS